MEKEKNTKPNDDIADITVSAPKKNKLGVFIDRTDTVEVRLSGIKTPGYHQKIQREPQQLFPAFTEGEEKTYRYKHFFIKKVSVKARELSAFAQDLLRDFSSMRASYCQYVPGPIIGYFTMQKIDSAQKKYYVWWRDNYRCGQMIKVDSSYLLLYVFELFFNEKVSPRGRLYYLLKAAGDYAGEKINFSFTELIFVFCILYGLDFPAELKSISDGENTYLKKHTYAESVIQAACKNDLAEAIIHCCSSGMWKSSSYCNDMTRPFYEKHMNEAMFFCVRKICAEHPDLLNLKKTTYRYEVSSELYSIAFPLFIYPEIKITSLSLSTDMRLKNFVFNLEKYCENKIRDYYNIRYKLKPVLTNRERAAAYIDEYFAPILSGSPYITKEKEPEYMKKYDSDSKELEIGRAIEIEKDAWKITEKMSDAFSDDFEDEPEKVIEEQHDSNAEAVALEGLKELLENGSLRETSLKHNQMPESIVEIINDCVYELIGDICIEINDEGQAVLLEDYRTEIEEYVYGK